MFVIRYGDVLHIGWVYVLSTHRPMQTLVVLSCMDACSLPVI